ncbi:MAG: YbhB/YbcL family Raf kinase inhibitor-like protein [bacterium]|nr:YbhB/YbcL family Raf kinase inhibitor-like protein [bacterium]
MIISSAAFLNSGEIPVAYTCNGENINPPLIWGDIPEGTKSLALIVDDPDAPGGTWTHWVVWNIDPEDGEIVESRTPPGASEGITSFGEHGYDGPCPPDSSHRYFFTLYALDTDLGLPDTTTARELQVAMKNHVITDTYLMGTYEQ